MGPSEKTHSMQTRDGNRRLVGRSDDENRREQVVDTSDLGIINDCHVADKSTDGDKLLGISRTAIK